MDVFGSADGDGGAFLRTAAIAAGHELDVFATLARGDASLGELAARWGLGHDPRRLRALVDVLVALGAIARRGERLALGAVVPARPTVVRAGWGLMADVIRNDRPLAIEGADLVRGYHRHLVRAGGEAARELAPLLGPPSLLDLGGGAGTYTAAFLAAHAGSRATVVDTRDVLALAAEELAPLGARVRLVEGDAREVPVGEGHRTALLANVLHLHAPAACAELCAAAARAVVPGGMVVIKDLRVDDGRAGPIAGLLFALNMAIYTEAGDVHETAQLRAWLAAAGLVGIEERRLEAAPDAVVMIGCRARHDRRPQPATTA